MVWQFHQHFPDEPRPSKLPTHSIPEHNKEFVSEGVNLKGTEWLMKPNHRLLAFTSQASNYLDALLNMPHVATYSSDLGSKVPFELALLPHFPSTCENSDIEDTEKGNSWGEGGGK